MARKVKAPSLSKITTLSHTDIDKNFSAIAGALATVAGQDILSGHTVSNVTLTASGTTNVQHGLGRPAQGYIIVKRSAPVAGDYWVDSERPKTEISIAWSPPSGHLISTAIVSLYIY